MEAWFRAVVVALLALSTASCSAPPDPPAAVRPESPSATPSGPATPAPPTPTPVVATVPLVLVTHLTHPSIDLSAEAAQSLVGDGAADLSLPGFSAAPRVVVPRGVDGPPGAETVPDPDAALAAVRTDPEAVALVPGHLVDPTVRAVRIDGVDPMRSPQDYPLTTPGEPPGAVVTVSIGGDVMMDRRVGERLAATGDFAEPFRPIADRLSAADITVVNLESTLAELGPATQGNESFVADPRIREGLTLAGVDVVSLANNHTGDYGPDSLLRTIELLGEGGFALFGAGADLAAADRPAVVLRDGVSVAFVGFNAIGETPPAAPEQPGASSLSMPPRTGPLDQARLQQILDQVTEVSSRADVVVVVPHWGTQYTAVPVPEQSEVGQALLAAGADIVVGGHPHWVQAMERSADGRLVLHSLGNLVFDMDFSVETMQGVVAELVVWDDRVVAVDLVPYVIGGDWAPRWVDPQGPGRPILERVWQASTAPFASRP